MQVVPLHRIQTKSATYILETADIWWRLNKMQNKMTAQDNFILKLKPSLFVPFYWICIVMNVPFSIIAFNT